MANNTQSRKWQITINNPGEKNLTHDKIRRILEELKSVIYWCMSDEIGEQGTPHTHIYIQCSNPMRFSTLKNRFPEAHVEAARGSAAENRDYVSKTGKWKDDPKADTSVPGTFEESGELPEEPGQGYRSDIAAVYNLIADGKSNAEIMALNAEFASQISRMDKIRLDILEDRYRNDFRKLEVYYIFGPTGTGKTRYVMEKEGYSEVYRVVDYTHPFDRYAQEPVLCFDEFRSSLLIGDMLNYLDGYPLNLPARYAQRVACYTQVYLISNIDLKNQYPNVCSSEPKTWEALARRIHHVIEYRKDAPPIDHGSALEYLGFIKPEKPPAPPEWTQGTLTEWDKEDEARLWGEVDANEKKAG